MKTYGIYHKGCSDGSMSAVLLKKAVPGVILYPTSHSWEWKEDLILKKGDSVYFVDICGLPEDLAALDEKGVTYTIIDHHITADELIKKYEVSHDYKVKNYHYYPKHCATTAVWDYFFKDKKMPDALQFIEIADLWNWDQEKNSKFVDQYIKTVVVPDDLASYEKLLTEFDYDESVDKGKILYQRLVKDVEFYCRNASVLDFDGIEVLSLNSNHSVSELCNYLARKSRTGIGVAYVIYPDKNEVKVHVRGVSGDKARRLAEKYGGGGHDKAAGFVMTIDTFMKYIKK